MHDVATERIDTGNQKIVTVSDPHVQVSRPGEVTHASHLGSGSWRSHFGSAVGLTLSIDRQTALPHPHEVGVVLAGCTPPMAMVATPPPMHSQVGPPVNACLTC